MKNEKIVVTPLGTVSTYCTSTSNCPGFLVKYGNHKILLDCGNGISRFLNIPDDLKNLTIIISHLHSDHYGELLSLAQTSLVLKRLGYIDEKIKVYIPKEEKKNVKEYYVGEDGWGTDRLVQKNSIDYEYVMNLEKYSYFEIIPYDSSDKLKFDELNVNFAKNIHDILTYSTKLETQNLKLVYSSDTGYEGNSLEKFAKDANLLICESTFLRGQTRVKDFHLFAHEAGKIAKSANVEKLLLTHFWPSIDKQKYVDEAKEYFENTGAAEEGKKLILGR